MTPISNELSDTKILLVVAGVVVAGAAGLALLAGMGGVEPDGAVATVKRAASYPHAYDKWERGTENDKKNGLCARDYNDFGKVALTNLRTGTLSYVSGARSCIAGESEVVIQGDII